MPLYPATIKDFFPMSVSEPSILGSEASNKIKLSSLTDKVPHQEYEEAQLCTLAPGPRRIKISARVVNIHDQPVTSKSPKAAKGCLKILVKDNNAALLVNLWYFEEPYTALCLGSLVTIWTTHVSSTVSSVALDALQTQPATILTSIFPERDAGCYIQIHQPDDQKHRHRLPLNYGLSRGIEGLLSLRGFVEGAGAEIADAKILVYIKAVGRPTNYTSPNAKSNGTQTVLNIGLADAGETATEAILSVFSPHLINTALTSFVPNQTVLLISYPVWRVGNKISIRARTQIDVDPSIPEALELRAWAKRWNRPVNEVIDESCFTNLLSPEVSPKPLRHTLSSFSLFIENEPTTHQVAYIPIIFSNLNISPLIRQKALFCMPCPRSQLHHRPTPPSAIDEPCSSTTPLYGLHPTTSLSTSTPHTCPICLHSPITLRLNPAVIGEMYDETGSLLSTSQPSPLPASPANSNSTFQTPKPNTQQRQRPPLLPPLLWTDKAYTSLLGRPPAELGRLSLAAYRKMTMDERRGNRELRLLEYLERRMSWMRLILLVGWTGCRGVGDSEEQADDKEDEEGRLVVLDVVV